ncbi:hypothetical protein N0V93_004680 [Gnomoniopsis smithogilvyi]|uniref:Uncharacterized protein n=1 Tax=Gnomoniopsis smithogilvyi TaxID=1191159 RepID=A0A9W8YT16_9PEZI|nr:hypothetical protein N0V93_004680 [Gnomoniopsis smithogilvyi]
MQFRLLTLAALVSSVIAAPVLSIRIDADSIEKAKAKRAEAEAAGSSLEDIEIAAWYGWD